MLPRMKAPAVLPKILQPSIISPHPQSLSPSLPPLYASTPPPNPTANPTSSLSTSLHHTSPPTATPPPNPYPPSPLPIGSTNAPATSIYLPSARAGPSIDASSSVPRNYRISNQHQRKASSPKRPITPPKPPHRLPSTVTVPTPDHLPGTWNVDETW